MADSKFTRQNYYEILDIPRDAAENEINAAYQRAKLAYSPDSPALYTMFTKAEARELLKLIEEAFETLSNQMRRKAYDNTLLAKPTDKINISDLPDFDVPELSPTSSKATPAKNQKKPAAPAKNEKFEEEIRNCTEFDGGMLNKIRVYKNFDLEKLSEISRISKTYLTAIEKNDFKSLPAPVFVRGFIVQVARILELNNDQAIADSYMKIFRQHRPE